MATGQGVTLADMAAGVQPLVKKGTLEYMADMNPLSDIMTFTSTKGAMVMNAARINPDMQPAANYRGINSEGIWTSGALEPVTETLKILYSPIKIDRFIAGDTTNLFRPESEVEMAADSMQLEITNSFINGDGVTIKNTDGSNIPQAQPKGLRYRLQNAAAEGLDQDVYTLGITGASINLTGSMTNIIALNLMDSLEELQDRTKANTLFTNFRGRTMLKRAALITGALKTTTDNLFRTWDEIFGMRVIRTAIAAPTRRQRNTANSAAWVQPWETVGGVISATTGKYHTYFVANIAEGHVEGLTAHGMEQRGPEKLPIPASAVAYAMEFGFGFFVNSFADIGGLYGVQLLP